MIKPFVKKMLSVSIALLLVVLSLGGCSSKENNVLHYKAFSDMSVESGTVAENDAFSLGWDNDKKCVLLNDKISGKTWSSIPYDYYTMQNPEGVPLVRMHSPIILKYSESNTLQTKIVYAYADCISDNTVTSKTVKNGIEVTYYFERQQISVPVQYLLNEKGLEVRLMVEDIRESKNIVCEVSVSPFMCAVRSGTGGYLVLPSGSGALMYTDEVGRSPRTFKAAVYGEDENTTDNSLLDSAKAVRMPFFGVVSGEEAMCAIIEKGADSAIIEASAGDSEIGWSSAWATFVLRGYSLIQRTTIDATTDVSAYYTASHVYSKYFSVGYYPLHENKNYTGIAKCYSEYLGLNDKKADAKDIPLYLRFLGAVKTDELFLGIPYSKLAAATEFEDVGSILEQLSQMTDAKPAVQLLGFGADGLDCGAPLGGLSFASQLGGKKGYSELQKYCKKQNIPLYMDYDFIRYSSSGSGISKSDAVLSAKGTLLRHSYYSISSRNAVEGKDYFLLGFDAFKDAATTLTAHLIENGVDKVSLSSLSQSSYSDYAKTNGYVKNGFAVNAVNVMKLLSANKVKIASNEANAYAAKMSAHIFEAPANSDAALAADEEVPLYQIVFKGHVPMSVPSVNLADDSREMLLKAAETGSGLCFTLTQNWESGMLSVKNNAVSFSMWKSVKDDVKRMYDELSGLLEATSGASVSAHRILRDGVHVTEFSNGVSVTVNYTDSDFTDENGTVSAKSFALREG